MALTNFPLFLAMAQSRPAASVLRIEAEETIKSAVTEIVEAELLAHARAKDVLGPLTGLFWLDAVAVVDPDLIEKRRAEILAEREEEWSRQTSAAKLRRESNLRDLLKVINGPDGSSSESLATDIGLGAQATEGVEERVDKPMPLRLGLLNFGLKASERMPLNGERESGSKLIPSVQISLGSESFESFSRELPKIDPLSVVTKVELVVHTALKLDDQAKELLTQKVVARLERLLPTASDLSQAFKFGDDGVAQDPGSAINKSWLNRFLQPENLSLSILFGFIVVGAFLFLLGRSIVTGLKFVANSLIELKPKDDSSERKGGASVDADFEDLSKSPSAMIIDRGTDGSGKKSRSDTGANDGAMSNALNSLKAEFETIAQLEPDLTSEALRDVFLRENGTDEMRDLLSFVGVSSFQKLFSNLPEECLEILRENLQEESSVEANLLNGAYLSQSLSQKIAARLSFFSTLQESSKRVFLELARMGPSDLTALAAKMEPSAIALAFNIVSVEAGQVITKSMDSELLSRTMQFVDMDSDLIEKESEAWLARAAGQGPSASRSRKRSTLKEKMVRRFARETDIAHEQYLQNMIPWDDFDLRLMVWKERFLYADIEHLPADLVRAVLDQYSIQSRADILYLLTPRVRAAVFALYPEGSKQIEVLNDEISEIENSEKRKDGLSNSRLPLLDSFMERIQAVLAHNPEILDIAIENFKNPGAGEAVNRALEEASEAEAG